MFERRLKVVAALPVVFGIIIVARLYQLQVIKGDEYLERADAALVSPRQFLPPLRGRILDRFGRVLVSDEPAHDVTVHYGILSMSRSYLLLLADHIRKHEPQRRRASDAALEAEAKRRIEEMWLTIQDASGVPMKQLRERCETICESVERLRRHIWQARRVTGLCEPLEKLRLREEDLFHAILRDVTPEARTRIELKLSRLPCVRVEPSVRRVWADRTEPLCHILGRLGQVSADMIRNDPLGDDWLASYRAGDEVGISGVERLSEHMLRGKRGFEERYLDGRISDRAPPIDGLDVQLTIDLDLQRQLTRILEDAVAAHPPSTGASCAVIDVASREILALVSIPTYDLEDLRARFEALRDDARRLPLLFRAVQGEYQPGSILKPVALLAGFANGLVDPDATVFCDGQLIPGSDKWHCWTHWRGMPGHGYVNAEEAIQHSCNVYFYTLGQRINGKRLTDFYRLFIQGRTAKEPSEDNAQSLTPSPQAESRNPEAEGSESEVSRTGLVEERPGLIPTLDWMKSHRKRGFRLADGRNYAIGQGEIQITPLQAANAFATLAAGYYQDPTIIANDMRDRPAVPIRGIPESAWRLTRRGLYRCVNEPGGTAYKHARLDAIEICGKTGSAQCVPRVVERRFTFLAEQTRDKGSAFSSQGAIPNPQFPIVSPPLSIVAPTAEAACESLGLPPGTKPVKTEAVRRYPPPDPESGEVPTHAWFAGFAPYRNPRIALAVLVEHGGGGGHTAGPIGRDVFEALLESPRGYLKDEG
ncbi:MAG: hypothetical protein JXQ75_20225 [Phycisphaerae bacterium]|nr:hypothetical protein [Phycisphaerae bacterium]